MTRGLVRVVFASALLALLAACRSAPTAPAPSAPSAPAGAAPSAPWFESVAQERGLVFQHRSGRPGQWYLPDVMGGGVALFDMDGDGDLDAFFTQGGVLGPGEPAADAPRCALFANDGGGRFTDVSAGSGADIPGYGMGVAAGDADEDGDADLLVTRVGRLALLVNDGRGRFEDRAASAGLVATGWATSAAFFDFDRDGDLDIVITNYLHWSPEREIVCYNQMGAQDYCSPRSYEAPTADLLYRNDGDGRFTDISAASGITGTKGNGLGVVCADFNGDGWQDIFVANDGLPNHLWINGGDGTFREQGMLLGCAVDSDGTAKAGMGVAAEDIDGDDDLDILVGNLVMETDSLYRWDGQFFTDATRRAGLAGSSRQFTRFGLTWTDFDQDGCLDLYEANGRVIRHASAWAEDGYAEPDMLFRGACAAPFTEMARAGMTEPPILTGRGLATGDVDGDGAVDLVIANLNGPALLLRNVAPDRGGAVTLRVLERSGRDALGAIVRMTVGERRVRRDVRAAGSYLASSDPRVHVGLGPAAVARDVEVTWADGGREAFGDIAAGADVTLRRGSGER